MIKIGYQGMKGSNSEEASKRMAKLLGLEEVELEALINSQPVVDELNKGNIDYGVMAIENSFGGIVKESQEATKDEQLKVVSSYRLPIVHSLFKKREDIDTIELVVSHEQALKQTKATIQKLLPDVKTEAIEDTAIGAYRLANGELEDNVAVICRKNAGEDNGLYLVKENINDSEDNVTEFYMYELG